MALTVPSTPTTATAQDTGTNGITINKPSSLQDDDVLYAIICKDWNAGAGAWACSGWTRLAEQSTVPGRNFESAILRKVITSASGEPSTYTFTNGDSDSRNMCAIIIPVRGADTSTPEDATTTENAGTNNDNPDSPSITTNTDGALVIPVSCLAAASNSGLVTWSAPTGYTIAGPAQNSAGGLYTEEAGAYLVKASAGSTGAISWNNTANDSTAEWHTYTIAVKPATVSGVTLAIADVAQAQNLEAAGVLTQVHNLSIADATQAQNLEAIQITQVHNLAILDLAQEQRLEAIAITITSTLAIDDLLQAQSLEAAGLLSQAHNLAIADLLQEQSLESLLLSQQHYLAIADLRQDQRLDNINLSGAAILVVQDLQQVQLLDGAALGQVHLITVQDAFQAQSLDGILLTQIHNLVVDDLNQEQRLDSFALGIPGVFTLEIEDLQQEQALESLLLEQDHFLAAVDLFQEQRLEGGLSEGEAGRRIDEFILKVKQIHRSRR